MIHAQGIVFDTNTDIIIDSATFARLLRLNTQNLSRFYVKTQSYKTNSFHSAKKRVFSRKKNYTTKVRSTYAAIPIFFRHTIGRQSKQRLYSLFCQVFSWLFPKVLIEIAKNSGNPPFSWWKNKNDATETLSNGPRSSFKVETRQPKWLPSILQRTTGPN